MIVNKAAISAVFVNLRTIFNKAFAETQSTWQKIAMRVPSSTKTEDYGWLSKFPKMRKWIGDKAAKSLAAFKYSITNDDFEATVSVDRNDIDDDTIGIYAPQAKGAGESAKEFPDELVYEAVNGAFVNLCYDGQYFCDTDHPVGVEGAVVSVSNKGVAPLSNATRALADAGYGAARVAMRKFKDDEGRSLNVRPNVLLVGPSLETTANGLMGNEKLADDTPNPYRGQCEVVVDNRILSDTAWFLLDTTRAVKPFIYQERKAPVFVQQVDPESDDVFNRRILKFGCEGRGASGYGFWQLCFGSTGLGA